MSGELGTLLRGWRTERGLSLGGLALKAGVAKSTLSYWESGRRRPSIPELDAVFAALQVAPTERTAALIRIGAPRALRQLRQDADETAAEGPLLTGDLLRVMRIRRGMRLEAVAAQVGVRASTLSRWERSEAWPQHDRLRLLCRLLGAREEETTALLAGRLSLAAHDPGVSNLGTLRDEHGKLWRQAGHNEWNLMDLRFLALQGRLWPHARSSRAGLELLAMASTSYARWLLLAGRRGEAQRQARRSFDMTNGGPPSDPEWVWNIHVETQYLLWGTERSQPQEAARLISDWLPVATGSSLTDAWFYQVLGVYQGLCGETQAALNSNETSRRLRERRGESVYHADLGRAHLLAAAGRPEEALAWLPREAPPAAYQQIRHSLTSTEVLLEAREHAAASEQLRRAYERIRTPELGYLAKEADALARRL